MASPQSPSPTSGLPTSTLLHAITAIPVCNGVVGLAGGAANDSRIVLVTILKNAGPATLTIGGFKGEDGTARNVVLSGSASVDTMYYFSEYSMAMVNSGGPLTFTASVADTVLVTVCPA